MNTDAGPVSVAIVGLGRAGWRRHLQPLSQHSGFRIVAVADPLPERCAEASALTGCRGFSSIDALLQGGDSEVVVVATPSSSHTSDAEKVLNSGRHCVVEKPMAGSFAEAGRLLALARQRDRKLFVNHSMLHQPEYHHLRNVLDSGALGPLFDLRFFSGSYARRWDWQTLKKNGGGLLNNEGTHVLSVVLPLLGARVTAVSSDLRHIKDAGDAEDHVHLVLKTDQGVSADVLLSTAIALEAPRWMLCGKYGTLVSDGTRSHLRRYDPAKAAPLFVLDAAAPNREYLKETLPWEEQEMAVEPPPVATFYENVYDVLRRGGPQVVTPEGAVNVMRVLELARQSLP